MARIKSLSSFFSTDLSKELSLLQFCFVCASMVSYVAFVLSLFVPHLSFFWCLKGYVLGDWGISLVFSLFSSPELKAQGELL